MKTLYLECNMGAAGDMLMAALLELLPESAAFLERMNGLGLAGVSVSAVPNTKCGINGTQISVVINGHGETSDDVGQDEALPPHADPTDRPGQSIESVKSKQPTSSTDEAASQSTDEATNPPPDEEREPAYVHYHVHAHDGVEHAHDHVHTQEHNHHDHNPADEHIHVPAGNSDAGNSVAGNSVAGNGDADSGAAHDTHAHAGNGVTHIPNPHADHDSVCHHHAGLADITQIISALPVSDTVKENALAIYDLIAAAESHAHGVPVDEIHFHEVGRLDAIADIVGVCLLLEEIAPARILVSPIRLGGGHVHSSHGVLPVPAPATAHILMGVPTYGGGIQGELCTPTGAAILKHFADDFTAMPPMKTEKIGYGMGQKEFAAANCVRAFLGDSDETGNEDVGAANGHIAELCANIDDMTGEALGEAMRALLEAGAVDVFATAVMMKKGRPGFLLTCLCDADASDSFAALILRHTSTFGVRGVLRDRYILERETSPSQTTFGTVRQKTGQGYGIKKTKLEHDDVATLAKEHDCSVHEMERQIYSQLTKKKGTKAKRRT